MDEGAARIFVRGLVVRDTPGQPKRFVDLDCISFLRAHKFRFFLRLGLSRLCWTKKWHRLFRFQKKRSPNLVISS